MTPEQETNLFESIAGIQSDVAEIKGHCGPCREEVQSHRVTLDGRPGNNPGLVTRVSLLESNQKTFSEMREANRKERERNIKWFRFQLASVIAALLGFLGMAATYFFAVG